MSKTMGFAGSFDPMTNGHLWVLEQALSLADEVVVVVAVNAAKQTWFSPDARVRMIEEIVREKGWASRVRVITLDRQFVAPVLKRMGVEHMIRGIRNIGDFEQERTVERVNDEVLNGAKTWFVTSPSNPKEGLVSSSLVKSFIGLVNWPHHVQQFVPPASFQALLRRTLYQEWSSCVGERTQPEVPEGWLLTSPEGVNDPDLSAFLRLMIAYEGPDRHHHGLAHIASVIAELRSQERLTPYAGSVDAILGAFLHDAVYRGLPSAGFWGKAAWRTEQDETRSAELVETLLPNRFAATYKHLREVVLGTMHGNTLSSSIPTTVQALVCADLAVLAQDAAVYDAYARNVRREYAEVPEALYRTKRAEILETLAERGRAGTLFPLPGWMGYNAFAVANLERERTALLNPAVPLPV